MVEEAKVRLVAILGMIVLVAGCNSATTGGFRPSLRAPYPEIVSTPEPVRTGDTAMKFHVDKNDCRRDDCKRGSIRHEMLSETLYGEKWLSYSFHLPQDFNDLAQIRVGSGGHRGIVLGQFHRGGAFPSWLFQMSGSESYVASNYLMGHGGMPHETIAAKDELYGKWLDVLIHAKFTSNIDGFVRIYVNGETTPRYSYDGITQGKGSSTYFKFGIYQWNVNVTYKSDPSNTVYWDNVGVHSNCTSATREVFFDCAAIEAHEGTIARNPVLGPCDYDDSWICKVEMARDSKSLNERFACFLTANAGAPDLPTQEQINQFIEKIVGYDEGKLVKEYFWFTSVFGEDTLTTHGHSLEDLANVSKLATTEDYCASL